ncbi:MAG: c-type cytochrome [Planctomycetota bacterium]|nr:c-type cytochrome [Planctomycetota bacterium]MDA1139404.1 c-type cytochrome [Planctomycetota bacterium]
MKGSLTALLVALLASPSLAEDGSGLVALVQVLMQVEDPGFQKDVLEGMLEGLRGRKNLPMPEGWPDVYSKLSKSESSEVRDKALKVALIFGDPLALKALRKIALSPDAESSDRRSALQNLVNRQTEGLAPLLHELLKNTVLRKDALIGLARYSDEQTPKVILANYTGWSREEQAAAINTLVSRRSYALVLLRAVHDGQIATKDISAFAARQMKNMDAPDVLRELNRVWGTVQETSADKKALVSEYKTFLSTSFIKKANLKNGRVLFNKTCLQCHTLFGTGGKIGPELTGSNRDNLDYVLENVLTPNAFIGKGYELTNILSKDEQLISGIIVEQNPTRIVVQTLSEKIVLDRSEISEMKSSQTSMMPEGLVEGMTQEEVRDLIGYLASPVEVPLD